MIDLWSLNHNAIDSWIVWYIIPDVFWLHLNALMQSVLTSDWRKLTAGNIFWTVFSYAASKTSKKGIFNSFFKKLCMSCVGRLILLNRHKDHMSIFNIPLKEWFLLASVELVKTIRTAVLDHCFNAIYIYVQYLWIRS